MIDVNEMRRKFPAKKGATRAEHARAIKRIAQEYEQKRAQLGLRESSFRRGPLYYGLVIVFLLLFGGAFIGMFTRRVQEHDELQRQRKEAQNSVDVLAQALGRYRFHTGVYPTTAEGIEALAKITPDVPGWFGPYITEVKKDPWGQPYLYDVRGEGEPPAVYSSGPDRKIGTPDDILPTDLALFEKPFRDTTWTNHWQPYYNRRVILARDPEEKRKIEQDVQRY